jgi:RNA polymerase sigma-70 factor (ECF subfamily)
VHDDDELLIRGAQQADVEAFGELYRRHFERVYRYVAFQVRSEVEAEDLTADVFLRAYRAIGGYQSRGVPFSAWLFRIARNSVIDFWRRRRPMAPLESVVGASAEVSHDDALERALLKEEIATAMARLTDAQRQVLALRFGAGLASAEVARIMKRSEGAVKALQHAGLDTLRRQLGVTQET